jgi:hypothetical protein
MPHFGEFPNLERLDLEGCIKLVQLDPSIRLLTKLVYLNLNDCKSIISLLSNIFGLSCLDDLNMFYNPWHLNISASHSQSRTSSIFRWITLPYQYLFPTPTTHTNLFPSWHGLRELDISFCGLCQIPDSIGCLYGLVGLNVGGNNFVTVPSLRELSNLVCLHLEHCPLLKSLPKLPSHTAFEHDYFSNNLGIEFGWLTGLLIFNCPNLGESCSSMTFSWMIQLIQANPQSSPDFSDKIEIVIPGSEIPSWFNNQNKGDSIRIDSSPIMHDKNNNIIGCVCCVVFSMAPRHPTMIRSSLSRELAYMGLRFTDIHGQERVRCQTEIPVILNESLIMIKSNHIWLTYFPLKSAWDVLNETLYVETENCEDLGIEVKNCGYRWVYKEDLQESKLNKDESQKFLNSKAKVFSN